jgi:hypothetical protein
MFSAVTQGQTILGNFDDAENDTTYKVIPLEGSSTLTYTNDNTDKIEGAGSCQIKVVISPNIHDWGSHGQLNRTLPEGQYFDLSSRDTLSLWIKVIQAPALPASVVFRIHMVDQPTPTDNMEEYIYEHTTILDAVSDWVELKVPLFEREVDTGDPNSTGFILFPGTWGRSASQENNKKFDLDKIIGYNIGFITTTAAADSVVYNVDNFTATGNVAIPYTFFNGVQWVTNITVGTWGNTTLDIIPADEVEMGKKAVQWTQGDGWTGFYGNLTEPAYNMSSGWAADSLKIKMKAPEGTGPIRIQFMDLTDGGNKIGTTFTPTGDNQWHEYFLPLRDMIYQDGSTHFDSTHVAKIEIMGENSGVAGRVIYFTDVWTGMPTFDVIPPVAATGVSAIADDWTNLVTWTDVPGEAGEKYDIYYSTDPITDVAAKNVDVVQYGVNGDVGLVAHVLRAPKTDQPITYYYAIVCRDAAGNVGPVSESSAPVTNTAKGVPTIEPTTINFTADGDLSEWSSVTPIELSLTKGTAYLPPNNIVDGDADLSLLCYLAIDNDYLYVAFDVEDDQVTTDASSDSYMNDCPDLFIGLFNWHGVPHTAYKRGAEPDYHIRFNKEMVRYDGGGISDGDSVLLPGADYYWEESFPTGYTVEARLSLDAMAERGGDTRFIPRVGNRIPVDFSINDADGAPREGIICYSPNNNDQSYSSPSLWTYTWIGDQWTGVADNKNISLDSYQLLQNYPNPFNPSTQISYVLKNSGMVSVKVYDILGREVATLVNEEQTGGLHTLNFDASNLASGMYIYKIDAGSFHSSKKMLFLK